MTILSTKVHLDQVAKISVGLMTVRKLTKEQNQHRYKTLNLRSVTPHEVIDMDQLELLSYSEPVPEAFLTRRGDVIVRNIKPYTAITITDQTSGLVIPASYIIIRVSDRDRLDPEYLSWEINSAKTQQLLFREATGYSIASISASHFRRMELLLPSLSKQRQVAEFNALAKKEVALLRQLAEARENLYRIVSKKFKENLQGEKK